MNREEQKVFLMDSADYLLRSWWTLVAGLCLGLAVALLVLHYTPRLYEARVTVDAYSEMLPDELIRPTVSADTEVRLRKLRKRVMAPPEVTALVSDHLDMTEPGEERDAIVRGIMSGIALNYRERSRFFQLSYRDTDPERAAVVVNAVADRFIEENRLLRASLAGENTKTLEQLAAGKLAELQDKENEIAEYKRTHPLVTQDQLPFNYQELNEIDADLEANKTAKRAVQEHLDLLEAQKDWGPLMETSDYELEDAAADPTALGGSRLSRCQAELEQLRHHYSENHPDVVSKRRECEDLLATAEAAPEDAGSGDAPAAGSTQADAWGIQIKAAQRELNQLDEEERELKRRRAQVQGRIGATPQTEQRLSVMLRDAEMLRGAYRDYQNKIEKARAAQKIEEDQRGSQFAILEPAGVPRVPVSPNPMIVIAVGALLGLGLFLGPLVLRRLLSPVLMSEARLKALSDVPVLVRIPSLETPDTAQRVRRNRLRNFALSGLSIAVLLTVSTLLYLGRI